ncbi:hypothetical protein [Geobacillus phage TP-84]|uniref:hypothetical protein n=1 Tax=Geobacillus phage TP-84 TaxID=1965361 RepID=UPI0009C21C42|nr:hypothetical protein MUK65_gp41 [Geobacillus phage TP-84]UNW45398.1 hypothetical protein [Geobacillus phage TP-84]
MWLGFETRQQYLDWLESLQPGNEVAVGFRIRYGRDVRYEIRTVTRVTNRQIILDDGAIRFNRGTGKQWGGYAWIEPVTEKILSQKYGKQA